MTSRRKTAEREHQHRKELIAARAAGRVAGLRDALLLLGLGVGLGLADALDNRSKDDRDPEGLLKLGTRRAPGRGTRIGDDEPSN